MPQTLLRRTQLTFIWVALVPVVLAVLAWWGSLQYRARVHWVSHTQQVLSEMDNLLLAVTSAETGQRGYVLTGDESYLEPFRAALPQVDRSISRLRELIRDSGADQQARLEELTPAVHLKMDELRGTVELRRTQGEAAAVAQVRTGLGHRAMDAIRRITLSMNIEEERLLGQRLKAQRSTEVRVAACFGAGIVVSIVLLFWAYHLIVLYANERKRAEQEAVRLSAELEQRVIERTAELRAANASLLRSNADLERFAYVASHDLQEPLRMVSAYVDLLARRYEGKLDKDADDYIHFAIDGASRMRLLISDLLAYSRTGMQALRIAPTDFEKVLETALENLQILREESRAEIVSEPLPAVRGDEAGLVLVLQNLLSNAMKFRQPDRPPRVRVAATRHGDEWRFVVEDNGIGFDGQYADRIFEIFQRLHAGSAYPGTGIGLAISKRIIEAHGGRMWAESTEGAGSKFWFSLPATEA
ncbi:MAG: CHASE3 domain-containing protein [Bryobacteraceae bacterium]